MSGSGFDSPRRRSFVSFLFETSSFLFVSFLFAAGFPLTSVALFAAGATIGRSGSLWWGRPALIKWKKL